MPRLIRLASAACLLRHLPLFFAPAPRTPLRVLCIGALDIVHARRYSSLLPPHMCERLTTLLDFQAGANAVWDGKPLCEVQYQALRHRLEQAGLGPQIAEYLERLGELESRRPPAGGDAWGFDDVRAYRESVVRLSLAMVAAVALNIGSLDEAIRATDLDPDVAALFRMAMQCQIIDDLLDYRKDRAAGLPSFLTASASLPMAVALTADAARSYRRAESSSGRCALVLRVALTLLTSLAAFGVGIVAVHASASATDGSSSFRTGRWR